MRSSRRRLFVLALTVAAAFATALVLAPHSPDGLRALAASAGPVAPLALLVAWVVLTPALFPGTVLAAAGGLLLGPALGTAVSLVGATLGATAGFLAARAGAGRSGIDVGGERVAAIHARVERRGFLSVLALRAAPGVPATLLNYAAGLSRIRARDFVAGVTIGGAPRTFAYTALGGSLANLGSPAGLAAIGVLVAMTLGGVLVGWRLRRRAAGAPATP